MAFVAPTVVESAVDMKDVISSHKDQTIASSTEAETAADMKDVLNLREARAVHAGRMVVGSDALCLVAIRAPRMEEKAMVLENVQLMEGGNDAWPREAAQKQLVDQVVSAKHMVVGRDA